ncbi:GDSL-type esterase/lipase family protein [Teredinibacter waterburyi]|jgi:Lysophospholipase L1 and related esterases|uniref:GDSL-type esterase/lipase family protein n=1 Tax=Teredinibacter waterburyi TaxID=1500538 RepID=UPI00165F84F6|nr:GDSL-type esterase/lipase family protein [Teredinibacter waterburyi]
MIKNILSPHTKPFVQCLYIAIFTLIFSGCQPTQHQAAATLANSEAAIPAPRVIEFEWMSLATWRAKHAEDVAIAAKGDIDLLFLGDSITEGWGWGDNQKIFDANFGQYRWANFGIGGDQTQHLLWRLQNGSTGKLAPKVIVLMIGVNNFGHSNHSAEDVYSGIAANVSYIRKTFPKAKLVVHAVLPYDQNATSPNRDRVKATNALVATLADNKHVFVYDFGDIFLDPQGDIPQALMSDFLHPSHDGFQLFADNLAPVVQAFMEQ